MGGSRYKVLRPSSVDGGWARAIGGGGGNQFGAEALWFSRCPFGALRSLQLLPVNVHLASSHSSSGGEKGKTLCVSVGFGVAIFRCSVQKGCKEEPRGGHCSSGLKARLKVCVPGACKSGGKVRDKVAGNWHPGRS